MKNMNLQEENEMLRELIGFYKRSMNPISEEWKSVLLSEMPNLRQMDTDLPMNIFVTENGAGTMKHGIRIKVQNNYSPKVQTNTTFSVSVEENPRVLQGDYSNLKEKDLHKLVLFIRFYYDELIDLWYGNITTDQFKKIIKQGY